MTFTNRRVTLRCALIPHGLPISYHLAKAYVGKFKVAMDPEITKGMPDDQYGGCSGGGTDYASMVIKSLIGYAAKASLSIFVLFLDLVAAYDSIIREIAFGFPHNLAAHQQHDYLVSLGLSEDIAASILEYVEKHGTVLNQFGANEKVVHMVNALHTQCWAVYGDLQQVIVGYKGGRQGCKLDGVIFNCIYGVAMKEVRQKLSESGIVFVAKFPDTAPFWAFDSAAHSFTESEVIEATFVDDSSIALVSSSPRALLTAVTVLLDVITATFARFALRINFSKGKTESLLKLRGKNSSACLDTLR